MPKEEVRKSFGGPIDEVIKQQEDFKKRTYMPGMPTWLQQNLWVFGWTPTEHKAVVWGPYSDKKEAERYAAGLDQGEVFVLDTRNVARATQEIKSILVQRAGAGISGGLKVDDALQRMGHKRKE